MNAKLLFAALTFAMFACSGCASSTNAPIHRSDAAVRAWIVARTPLSSTLPQVRTTLDHQEWHGRIFQEREVRDGRFVVGSRAVVLRSTLGSYGVFLGDTGVDALWVFGDGKRLTEVRVVRATTSL